jgi:hypothetical protein
MVACPRELAQQSPHSPGVVQDAETLLYVLREPKYYEAGTLTIAAFTKGELQETQVSVCRRDITTYEVIQAHIAQPFLAGAPGRSVTHGLIALCQAVRAILIYGTQAKAFCVHDDGLDGFPGHTVIGFSDETRVAGFWEAVNNRLGKNGKVAARGDLTECFREKVPLAPAR